MDLRELYQEVILDHNKRPRNFREIDGASHAAEGYNPLCGDQVHLYVTMDGDRIVDLAFQGQGCAISTASASLMTEGLKGKTETEARALFERFKTLVTTEAEPDLDALGKLAVFAGVQEFPMRVKCATLVWHTLNAALDGEAVASTE
jgi:nitrogen fixation NifU-like protein